MVLCHYSDTRDPPSISVEDLKSQLEALQSEAEQARARANMARARFMRLTETVENLRMRAAVDLKAGKEESARQLIVEKKKVMQALEKSKQRAELLEELSNKLGEAISRKEVQLIAALSSTTLRVGDGDNTVTTSVRIISPKGEDPATDQTVHMERNGGTMVQDAEDDTIQPMVRDTQATRTAFDADNNIEMEDDPISDVVNAMLSTRPDLYPSFLSRIDDRLHDVEAQLHDFINVAAMVLPEGVGIMANEKVATVKQIWHDVLSARARIRKIVHQQQQDCG